MIYPLAIHFAVSQIVGYLGVWLLVTRTGRGMEAYYQNVMLLTGIGGLITMLPALYFYRRDKVRRVEGGLIPSPSGAHFNWAEGILLLLIGAALALYANFLMGLVQLFLKSTAYYDTMSLVTEGKGIIEMILWMGIVAPLAEETIFRWLIYLRLRDSMRVFAAAAVSAAIFGVYHGNLLQGIYAGILGAVFAYVLEMTGSLWSSVLLHIGANTWALLLSKYGSGFLAAKGADALAFLNVALLIALVAGLGYFHKKYRIRRKARAV